MFSLLDAPVAAFAGKAGFCRCRNGRQARRRGQLQTLRNALAWFVSPVHERELTLSFFERKKRVAAVSPHRGDRITFACVPSRPPPASQIPVRLQIATARALQKHQHSRAGQHHRPGAGFGNRYDFQIQVVRGVDCFIGVRPARKLCVIREIREGAGDAVGSLNGGKYSPRLSVPGVVAISVKVN